MATACARAYTERMLGRGTDIDVPGMGNSRPMEQAPIAQPAIPAPPALPPKPQGRWLPLIGLLAVMLFVTFGGFLFSGVPSGYAGEVEVGSPIEVSGGVTIQPAAGWVEERPLVSPPGVRLVGGSAGNGFLDASIHPGQPSPGEVVQAYVAEYLEPQSTQLSVGDVQPVALPGGQAAVVSYVGVFQGVDVTLEGEVIGILGASGTAVVIDAWSQENLYAAVQDQVVAMASSVTIP